MANEKDMLEGAAKGQKNKKQQKREDKAREQLAKMQNGIEEEEDTGERLGGKIVLFIVTLLIIAIWLGIFAILVKSDVGGFGSCSIRCLRM